MAGQSVPTSMRLAADLKEALDKAAKAEGRSVSNMTDRILRGWLTERGHLPPIVDLYAGSEGLVSAETAQRLLDTPASKGDSEPGLWEPPRTPSELAAFLEPIVPKALAVLEGVIADPKASAADKRKAQATLRRWPGQRTKKTPP